MNTIIKWIEGFFAGVPMQFLEVWGTFSFLLGFALMVCAFGGFTFRPGGRWGFGRERQSWDNKALLSMVLTFVLILGTGYLGSFIVLVPGAQTFESLKDLSVFICIVLFGYPALIIVPFAYGLSDLIEGVPPRFLWDWIFGYFINPACFWVAYQLIGKNPDFRKARTWSWYLLFVVIFMGIEPQLWGYICADKFTKVISYQNITPALFFTTLITWSIAPFAMLGALPLARKYAFFWAEIPGHVKERLLRSKEWLWESGRNDPPANTVTVGQGLPTRLLIVMPFVTLVLAMVGATAFFVMRSAERDATKLASRLHEEISQNINLQLDDYLEKTRTISPALRMFAINDLLQKLPIARQGRAFIIDHSGRPIASSVISDVIRYGNPPDLVVQTAVAELSRKLTDLKNLRGDFQYQFEVITAKPLSRETWLAQASVYQDRSGANADWILMTAMPAAYYLEGVRTGHSQSAMVSAVALLLSLVLASLLATMVTNPLRRIVGATQSLAQGRSSQHLTNSKIEEFDELAQSFNDMAKQITMFTERLQLATNAASLGIWDWDVVANKLVWDEAMYRLYGVRKEDFSGDYEAWEKSLAPADLARAKRDIELALKGEREFETEFAVIWRDGSRRIISGVARTIRDEAGRPLRMVGINSDITERKRTESELQEHRHRLEHLVEERTLELESAKNTAVTANLAKSQFLANTSHEIRTPMNAVLGFAQLLARDPSLSPAARLKVDTILKSGEHLLGIINDIMEVSRIEAGRVELRAETVDLEGLLGDLAIMFRQRAEEKGLSFTIDCAPDLPRHVLADLGKLRQVLINLLGNALKFTARGSIVLRARPVGSDRVVIEVQDTGIGMSLEEQQKLFQPFERTRSGEKVAGGTGLGLAISRAYARLMAGEISIVSAAGAGSCFCFEFVAPTSARQPVSPLLTRRVSGLAPGQQPIRVLVVDDESTNRALLREMLVPLGFIVEEAVDGQDSIAKARAFSPRVILMDLVMPGMNGNEATRILRNTYSRESLAIIGLSASAFAEEKQHFLDAGIDAFVAKPFREEELFEAMTRFAGVAFATEELPPVAIASDSIALAPLAREILPRLRAALEEADLDSVLGLIDQIAVEQPELAQRLREKAVQFNYPRLLAWLDEAAKKI